MQLRRETDYALRIMIFFSSLQRTNKEKVSFGEICRETKVPFLSAKRICQTFERKGWAEFFEEGTNLTVTPISTIEDITLQNILEVFDDEVKPFHIFDKRNKQYRGTSKLLKTIQDNMSASFENITLKMVTELNEKTDRKY